MAEKTTQKTKSFSVKKTDNPVIKEFIDKQSNFSESIRYLIIKYCRENGEVEDISKKLTELIYSPNYLQTSNNNLQEIKQVNTEEKTIKKLVQSEPLKDEKKEIINSSPDEISVTLDVEDKAEDKVETEEIPSCYE